MSEITEKELKVIQAIYEEPHITQRNISQQAGVSLGLTNVLISRLVKKGYLKVKRFNTRNIKYVLTPRGIKEKTKKTYKFMKRSLKVINKLKNKISGYALQYYDEGERRFIVAGEGELADITEIVLKSTDLNQSEIIRKSGLKEVTENSVIFNTENDKVDVKEKNTVVIDIWNEAEKLYGSSYEL